METAFEKLKKISAKYKTDVNELAEEYDLAGRRDYLWSDAEQARMKAERDVDFNGRIDTLAQKAQDAAAPIITELRGAVEAYVTNSTDPDTLATLQGLLSRA
ncbi:hypothetical protein AALA80_17910 [Oscillospiraceae bacterium 50-60]